MHEPTPHNTAAHGATAVVAALQQAGFTAYFAGGCVRDMLMGTDPEDYDIATSATPEDVLALFPVAQPVGKSFGVVIVHYADHNYEVATFRQDLDYQDGRHPHAVVYTTAEEDAQRRDFTINAMFHDPLSSQTYDYTNGREDIARRTIRCVGDASTRFREDHLRMLRAIRFAAVLDFQIDNDTRRAIQENACHIGRIANERIGQELRRIFTRAQRPGDALRLLDDLSLLAHILPEVAALKGLEQPPDYHPEGDAFTHTVRMLNALPQAESCLMFASLLHDIGKPSTLSKASGRISFHGHARVGADLARTVLMRLRFTRANIQTICSCIGNHRRFAMAQEMRQAKLRRLIAAPTFDTELALHRADRMASNGDLSNYRFLADLQAALGPDTSLPQPLISGHDLLTLDIPEGPDIGRMQQDALDYQMEHPGITRAELLDWVQSRKGRHNPE